LTIIRVEAGDQGHDVIIGPLTDAPPGIVITDEKIWALHGAALPAAADPILVPEGEAAKDWQTLAGIVDELTLRNAARDTAIIAFGGGSIGDVAGLAASLFKRGCPLVHVPTTLVAQVDSAIGGKTAIDAAGVKNLVGTFHLPALVLCDPAFLLTLDRRQLRAGYAELIKYGLIDDPAMFAWCEAHAGDLLDGDLDLLGKGVAKAVTAKARFVADDLRDLKGTRALLNFGHTFGHAIEAASGFGPVLHGEAVAIGMALAFRLSTELGLCPADEMERAFTHLRSVGVPTTLAEAGLDGRAPDLLALMARDKKAGAGGLTLILTRGIGKAFVSRDVGSDRLAQFLERAD
jgi:3-dehydroquinate synthase